MSISSDIVRYDIIADCTDNVATRYLLNDACVLLGKPLVSGSALRFEGQVSTDRLALSISLTHTLSVVLVIAAVIEITVVGPSDYSGDPSNYSAWS